MHRKSQLTRITPLGALVLTAVLGIAALAAMPAEATSTGPRPAPAPAPTLVVCPFDSHCLECGAGVDRIFCCIGAGGCTVIHWPIWFHADAGELQPTLPWEPALSSPAFAIGTDCGGLAA